MMRYKIEDTKEWFALDRQGYLDIRDYILRLEESVDFAVYEIRASNARQNTGYIPPPQKIVE